MTRPRLTVVQHEEDCPLDRWEPWLGGVALDVVRPYLGDPVPAVGGVGDGLLVLGGEMSADDDAVAPWLPDVRRLLAEASAGGVPTLGICLGAQLLAVAAGGRVDVGAEPGLEAGVVDVVWRPEAADDELVGPALEALTAADGSRPVVTPQPVMHRDAVVELPAGSCLLASTAMYPHHAFRVGSGWGVQFHPEVGGATLARWSAEVDGLDPVAVAAQFDARDAAVTAFSLALSRSFVALVGRRPGSRLTDG